MSIPDVNLNHAELPAYLNLHFPNYQALWNSIRIDNFIFEGVTAMQRIRLCSDFQFEYCYSKCETEIGNNKLIKTREERSLYDPAFNGDNGLWSFVGDKLLNHN